MEYCCIKPVIYELNIDKNINLLKKKINFPSVIKDTPGKIWYIKKLIRYKTKPWQIGKYLGNFNLPEGCFILGKIVSKKILNKCYLELEDLYKNYKKLKIPYADYKSRNLIYLFTTPHGEKHPENNLLEKYKSLYTLSKIKNYSYLSEMCKKYMLFIINLYSNKLNITKDELLKNITISFIQYQPKTGIWLHIDNVSREASILYNISISKEDFYYLDLVPILVEGKAIRIKVNDGDMVTLSGESRYVYAHGIPYNSFKYPKYTLMIRIKNIDLKKFKTKYIEKLDYSYPLLPSIC